jgi:spermidine synthase
MTTFLEALAGSGLATFTVGLLLKSNIRSYLAEKGKHYATYDDIRKLVAEVQATGQPQPDTAAKLLDRQSAWVAKKELYERAMQYIANTRSLIDALILHCFWPKPDDTRLEEDFSRHANDRLEKTALMTLLPLYAPEALVQRFFDMIEVEDQCFSKIPESSRDERLEARASCHKAAWEFVRAAKADLGYDT